MHGDIVELIFTCEWPRWGKEKEITKMRARSGPRLKAGLKEDMAINRVGLCFNSSCVNSVLLAFYRALANEYPILGPKKGDFRQLWSLKTHLTFDIYILQFKNIMNGWVPVSPGSNASGDAGSPTSMNSTRQCERSASSSSSSSASLSGELKPF